MKYLFNLSSINTLMTNSDYIQNFLATRSIVLAESVIHIYLIVIIFFITCTEVTRAYFSQYKRYDVLCIELYIREKKNGKVSTSATFDLAI